MAARAARLMDVLLIDNNDSFTRNLEHLLAGTVPGARISVLPHRDLGRADLQRPDLIVISPGPGAPGEYRGYGRALRAGKPVLGVCLGMQIINEHFGGRTARLSGCVHGRTDTVRLSGRERVVARYHSLHAAAPGRGLEVLGTNPGGVIMCLGSREKRVLGCQFHPESFLTPDGGWFIGYAIDYLGLG